MQSKGRFSKLAARMRLQKNQLVPILASVVLCCPIAWSQKFSTAITGNAGACQLKQYTHLGKGDLADHVSDSCDLGAASGSSQASLDTSVIAMSTVQNDGGGGSSAEAIQTATLKPPKGFTGSKIQFSYTDIYALKLSGLGPATGLAKACWGIAQLGFLGCHETTTNGPTGGTVHGTFVLTKSHTGFQLTILKQVFSLVSGSNPPPPVTPLASGGAITTGHPHLILPKGWTCKYDSGTACP